MKKFLTLILFTFSVLLSYSQDWKEVKTENGIKIEYSIQEKHDESKDIHQEYYVLKFTNVTSTDLSFSINIMGDYGYGMKNISRDKDGDHDITLGSDEFKVGDVSINYLVIFNRFLDNTSNAKLVNFEIEITN
ncbi:MAG: hypothetical protein SLAVMIC_00269 [uncultured marine phage]|uniref:Uncharacterized protein n=1 Tax=uncultured marine phage TaxID=707152 RepID=A0A8D9FRE5_9VIRU|nr:MAG: hypothetical protein SLAVMIC_00269 [uncultured marine phage]